jgi:hypothetical protein
MKQLGTVFLFILLVGCGAPAGNVATNADTPMSEASPGGEEGATVDGAEEDGVVFKDLAFGERKAFMEDVVMPEMKPLFVERHPAFSCVSCHGENMTEVNFEMPNTLDPLNPNAMPFDSEDEEKRMAARFMKETVVPTMAGLLKEEPFNPETKSGFGCFDCHATAAR